MGRRRACRAALYGPPSRLTVTPIKTTVWLIEVAGPRMKHTIGDFEQLILLALVRLDADAYGASIRTEIEKRTGRTISAGALYTALDRMEKRGLVVSRLGDPTPERGGKRKRLYTLQPTGERALARVYESLRLMAGGLGARLRTIKD